MSARWALRELRNGFKGFYTLIASLALGVALIAAIESVKQGIQSGLVSQGAVLLGGDAEVELTYRFASNQEREWFDEISDQISEVVDFRSMIFVDRREGNNHALTQITAIDKSYPLKGQVRLVDGSDFQTALVAKNGISGVLMENLLVERLKLDVGQFVTIGAKTFRLGGIIESLPDKSTDGFGLAPRTLVYKSDLNGSGLLVPGTFFSSKYRLIFPLDSDFDAISLLVKKNFEGSGFRWRDARNAAPEAMVLIDRLTAFLVFVGLSSLVVGGVAVSSGIYTHLENKKPVIATLRSIGATNDIIFQLYFIQIACLAAVGILIGIVLGVCFPLILAPILEAALPVPMRIGFYSSAVLQAGLYGILIASIFTLWPLAKIKSISPATLFRKIDYSPHRLPAFPFFFVTLVLLVGLITAASHFTASFNLALGFFIGLLIVLSILFLGAFLAKLLAIKLKSYTQGYFLLRWAVGSISRPGDGIVTAVLALGIGLCVLTTIGQIDGNLRSSLREDLPKVAPSFFFVDIQKTQIQEFYHILETDLGVSRVDSAPMLRGIISKINGRPATEIAGDHWVLKGDRGVTYSDTKPKSSKIVAGEWWPKNYTGENQVSFAAEEAAEMGLKLGDELTINILGRDILARVTSFRDVNFSTAGIGFIMSMNPAALEKAPHSFIATVYAQISAEARILRKLSATFPNITAIRVKDVIDFISTWVASITAATSYVTMVTLLAGFLVLLGTAASYEQKQSFEVSVLRSLGAQRHSIILSFLLRSLILGAVAASVALVCGILASLVICQFVLDINFNVVWANALGIEVGGVLAHMFASSFFIIRALNCKPSQILRNYE